ncbi:hypothetical protein KXV93_006505 [Aspergillus fumigatus]|nr:hypothetical protein KXV93_006505 [Aspergillus fumigatus]
MDALAARPSVRKAKLQRSYETISYQQLFPSQAGSYYIHIQFPHGRAPPPPQPSQAQQAINVVVQAWEQVEAARQQAPIEPTQLHDANPWLQMIQWTDVKAPNPNTADPVEQGVLILYHTVDQLARKSQWMVTYCRQAIRMEAVHATSVRKHVQPWQQILGFFARM